MQAVPLPHISFLGKLVMTFETTTLLYEFYVYIYVQFVYIFH